MSRLTTSRQLPPTASHASRAGPPSRHPGRSLGAIEWRTAPAAGAAEPLVNALRRDLGGPRVIAFANPKGGVHKTTATVLAAATIGSVRGRGVVAWDDNELRGTLGLRAGSRPPRATIRHLVAELDEVESCARLRAARAARRLPAARLGRLLRRARRRGDPRFARKLDPHTVRRVLELLRRTHDVICVDTGNNVESANWQTVMQTADQLVITSVPREDAAFTADWMLDLLHRGRHGRPGRQRGHAALLPDAPPVTDGRRPGQRTSPPGPGPSPSSPTTRRWRRRLDRVQPTAAGDPAGLA